MDAHPHIGTNKLPQIIENMREAILKFGGEIHFNSKLIDFKIQGDLIKELSIESEKKGLLPTLFKH